MTRDECRTRINRVLNKAHSELFKIALEVAPDDMEFAKFLHTQTEKLDTIHHDVADVLFDSQLEVPTS